MILSVDLGTSVTKVALWDESGILSIGRSRLDTYNVSGGRAEQQPAQWWRSVTEACAEALSRAPTSAEIEVIGFSAARQSFVPVDEHMVPLGAGILWSDRRAGKEAEELAERCGGVESHRALTGLYLDAGALSAKIAWLAVHDPGRIEGARWLLSPRDLVGWTMTGQVATDVTLASATGLYGQDGTPAPDLLAALDDVVGAALDGAALSARIPDMLPPPVASTTVLGALRADAAQQMALAPGVPVVVGAGDRPCEVIGAVASPRRPMVSWGTTANVSVPVEERSDAGAAGMIVTRSAVSGWLLEGGLSAAGSLLEWLASTCSTDVGALAELGLRSPPGANGVLVTPWLGGARAPWWRSDAGASVLGLRAEHGLGDLARAAVEGVALDVARCLDSAYADGEPSKGNGPEGLVLGGAGALSALWTEVLTGTTGLKATHRRSGEAASAGAAILAGRAVGLATDPDELDPITREIVPDQEVVEHYGAIRATADRAAGTVLGVAEGPNF